MGDGDNKAYANHRKENDGKGSFLHGAPHMNAIAVNRRTMMPITIATSIPAMTAKTIKAVFLFAISSAESVPGDSLFFFFAER